MGQELNVIMRFEDKKTGELMHEFLMAYWRKGWSMTDAVFKFIRDTACEGIISEDSQSYKLEPMFIYGFKDFLLEQLGSKDSYAFSNSFWGSFVCYQQTVRQLGNINAWLEFFSNRYEVLDEIENAAANGEQPCFDGCFDPDAIGYMLSEYEGEIFKDKEKELVYVLYHLDNYRMVIEVENSY